MSPRRSLLARMLAEPTAMASLNLGQWERLVRQARRADLLPRLALQARRHLGAQGIPPRVLPHLEAAQTMQQALLAEVQREADHLERALQALQIPVVVLKGAAYLLSAGPAAGGRTLTDLDILVPKGALSQVESALLIAGWHTTHAHPYVQHYYRRWMHELRPMVHVRRGTSLDVHHAILPPTARDGPDPVLIIQDAERLEGRTLLRVPSAVDQILHSIVHLLFNEELGHGLRDLSDIDLLLRAHGHRDDLWGALFDRAELLGVLDELLHGLLQVGDRLQTPIPQDRLQAELHRRRFDRLPHRLLRRLWNLALDVSDGPTVEWSRLAASFALFIRAHAVRMPAPLLLRHLSIKACRHLFRPSSPLGT